MQTRKRMPDPQRKMRHLAEVTVFRNLPKRELEELGRVTTMTTVARGRVFYRPNEPSEVLFILKEGRVQLYRLHSSGKKLVIATLGPHTVFGEMTMVGALMNDTFAEAIEDCLICVLSHSDLERLILANPQVALSILETTGRRLRDAITRLEDMAFRSVSARMAHLLLELSTETGHAADVVDGYSHLDLAECIGTYRETATHVLNEFKVAGLVDIGRRRIVILDREGLEVAALDLN